MKRLHVIYDAKCALCQRCRDWLRAQPAFVELAFTPLQALDLEKRFPGIGRYEPRKQLVAISDAGGVYLGRPHGSCVFMRLRITGSYPCASRIRGLMPYARRVCEMISHNRLTLSRALHLAARGGLEAEVPLEKRRRAGCLGDCKL